MELNLGEVLQNACQWAREAGKIQMAHWRTNNLEMTTKQNEFDVLTIADRESEALILRHIHDTYPDHDILSEESGEDCHGSEWRWVIDPLDGTTNYSQGLRIFGVSIALEHCGEPVVGVVYAPAFDEIFTAVRGEGASLDGRPIRCSGKSELSHSVVATGMPYDRATNPDNNFENIGRMAMLVRGIRRCGSAALDLCYTAAGFFDGYWEPALHRWDIAAGMLIAREAGCVVEFYRPEREYSIIAAGPALFPALRAVIR